MGPASHPHTCKINVCANESNVCVTYLKLQDDYLYAFLTVKETLSMAARFYLAGTMNAEKREKQVGPNTTDTLKNFYM